MASPSVYQSEISMGMSRGNNVGEYAFDRSMTRNPENVITIFTVNTREQYSASGNMKFAGRAAGERYRKVGSLTDPKYFTDNLAVEGQKDRRTVNSDDGQWVAMDWLNPDNVFTLDQDFVVPNRVDDSTDLLSRGLGFIVRPYDPINGNLHDIPTENEIVAAETRLAVRRAALVRRFHEVSAQNPQGVPALMRNGEVIDALTEAGIETPYNNPNAVKVTCERCGDKVRPGIKFHKSETLGVICIEPSQEGWKAAVNAGIKQREDVPEDFRWAGRSPSK